MKTAQKEQTKNQRAVNLVLLLPIFLLALIISTILTVATVGGATTESQEFPLDTVNKEIIVEIPGYQNTLEDADVIEELEALVGDSKENENEDSNLGIQRCYTEKDVELIAKTVYGEALVTNSKMEMAAVVWCILNRVDTNGYACGESIEHVVTFPKQFHGYRPENPVTEDIRLLVIDVLDRWQAEKLGDKQVGRVLPKEYIYFIGDGRHNRFTKEWQGNDYWDWSLENPYES